MSKIATMPNPDHLVRVETQFDRFSKLWRDLYSEPQQMNDIVLHNRKDYCLDFLYRHVRPGSKVLDVGCGAGVVALEAVQKGYVIHGVDVAHKMIKLCNRLFFGNNIDPAKYSFSAGAITDLALPENSFDGILALGFLEYQTDELKVLNCLNKLLRPGGTMVITGPIDIKITGLFGLAKVYGVLKNRIKNWQYGSEAWKHPAAGISINRYSTAAFKNILQRAGFSVIDYKRHGYASFWPLQSIERSKQFKIEFFLHNNLTRLSKIVPIDRYANEIIAVAKKVR